MALVHRASRRVEFRDTDAAGIMHFSVYYTYMEEAEHEFWRACGLGVVSHDEEGEVSWPRVATSCDFREPLRFEDEFEVEVHLERVGEKSVTYRFRFVRGGVTHAEGKTTAVCCRLPPQGGRPLAIPIPETFRARLRAATGGANLQP